MTWKEPPITKLYEALGAIGDERIHLDGNAAKVYSSSGGKFYDVTYDPDAHSITANDNGSYWQGYLGYPSIAYVLAAGLVPYDHKLAEYLKDVAWKDLNTKYKNDFDRTEQQVRDDMVAAHHVNLDWFDKQLAEIVQAVMALKLEKPAGRGKRPPSGY